MHIHMEHRAPRVEANRRDFISFGGAAVAFSAAIGVGLTAVADATPVADAGPSPFRVAEAAYLAALARFYTLPVDLETTDHAAYSSEEGRMFDAIAALEEAPIANWREFADAFRHCGTYGDPDLADEAQIRPLNEELQIKLLMDAQRLAGVL